MTRRLAIVTLLTVTAAVGAAAQRQQPARLIVVNYTGAVITISAIVNGTAQGRARVTPGVSLPIVPSDRRLVPGVTGGPIAGPRGQAHL